MAEHVPGIEGAVARLIDGLDYHRLYTVALYGDVLFAAVME